jgi:hypothetical protein
MRPNLRGAGIALVVLVMLALLYDTRFNGGKGITDGINLFFDTLHGSR